MKVRGQRVNLGEIEAAMRLMEDVIADVVVLVVKRGEPQQAVVAFCRPSKQLLFLSFALHRPEDPEDGSHGLSKGPRFQAQNGF